MGTSKGRHLESSIAHDLAEVWLIGPTQERKLGTRRDAILNHPSYMISQKSGFDAGYIIGPTQVSQPLSCPD